MHHAQSDTHRHVPFSRRALLSLVLCILAATAALPVLAGGTGTENPTAIAQGPGARPDAPLSRGPGRKTSAIKPRQPAEHLPAASLLPTRAPAPSQTPAATPAPPPVRTGLTTSDYVNLRGGPGTGYKILSQLPVDAPAEVLAEQDGWYQVLTPWESSGWIAAGFFALTPDAAPAQTARLGTAGAVGRVNLRSGPRIEHATQEKLRDGAVLEVLALEGDWYRVRTPRGMEGWVSAEYVALDWIPDIYGGNGPPAEAHSSDVVRIAQEYLGARYVWGGSYPSGFDCSGLTWYVYRRAGVRIPGGSVQQFDSDYGRYVRNMDALVPGDLVFFERTAEGPAISHVGIYAGGGKMIAARSERLGVRYVSLLEPFWNSRFVGGIRPYR